jgi:hypothetical protein
VGIEVDDRDLAVRLPQRQRHGAVAAEAEGNRSPREDPRHRIRGGLHVIGAVRRGHRDVAAVGDVEFMQGVPVAVDPHPQELRRRRADRGRRGVRVESIVARVVLAGHAEDGHVAGPVGRRRRNAHEGGDVRLHRAKP